LTTYSRPVLGLIWSPKSLYSIEVEGVSSTTRMYTTLRNGKLDSVSMDSVGDGNIDKKIDADTGEVVSKVPIIEEAEVVTPSISRGRARSVVAGATISVDDGVGEEVKELYKKLYEALIRLKNILDQYEGRI